MHPIVWTQNGALVDVLLSDSAGGNLISNDAGDAFAHALATLGPEIALVRIRSDGPTFCTGRVSPMPKPGTQVAGETLKATVAAPALRVYEAIRNAPVPVLAVVRGDAFGYGCALVAACDLAIATPAARFRVPEMERGIPPLLVMTAMNGRVPPKTIAHLALAQADLDASAALQAGIVGEIVAEDALDARVEALTHAITSAPLASVRAIKEYLRLAPGLAFPQAVALAANLTGTALSQRFLGG